MMVCGVEVQVGEDAGDRDRVRDVGLAAGAVLALVRIGGEFVGLVDALEVGRRQVVELVESAPRRRQLRPRRAGSAGQRAGCSGGGAAVRRRSERMPMARI